MEKSKVKKHGSHGIRLSGRKLQRLRTLVLTEEPLCRVCLEHGRVSASVEMDHIVPYAAGGTDKRSNLQGICLPCHDAKTRRENGWKAKPRIGLDGYPVLEDRSTGSNRRRIK